MRPVFAGEVTVGQRLLNAVLDLLGGLLQLHGAQLGGHGLQLPHALFADDELHAIQAASAEPLEEVTQLALSSFIP